MITPGWLAGWVLQIKDARTTKCINLAKFPLPEKLCFLVCSYFQREVAAAIEAEAAQRVVEADAPSEIRTERIRGWMLA